MQNRRICVGAIVAALRLQVYRGRAGKGRVRVGLEIGIAEI